MKKKIIGIFVVMLVMTSAVISVAGIMNNSSTKKIEKPVSADATIEQNVEDSPEINEPNENIPMPTAANTCYLSVPAGAFIPISEYESYTNWGYTVYGNAKFIAPVYLPDGATVTKLSYHWTDSSTQLNGHLSLCVNYMTDWFNIMADVYSSGSNGVGNSFDNTIDHATIDNIHQSYYLYLITHPQVACNGAIIEYTCPTVNNFDKISESQQSHEPNNNELCQGC